MSESSILRRIKQRCRVIHAAVIVAIIPFASVNPARAATDLLPRPNVVFMYADDWRWDCIGVEQRERGDKARFPWLETPRLDKLAAEGIRFRNSFVVNSLCSPGRACVL